MPNNIIFSIVLNLLLSVCFIAILVTGLYFFKRFSFSKPYPLFPTKKKENSILTIGIIGDSWATFKKLDDIVHSVLLENGYENQILSSGQSGAKTKLIYQNIFKSNETKYSSRSVIENVPDYCIVLAGTNDAVGQMGPSYYSHHLVKIIRLLLAYKIKPVILTLPKVGIKNSQQTLNILQRWRNIISAYFNNKGELQNVETYRKRFNELIGKEKLSDKIIMIDFDLVCEGYKKDSEFYKNPIHLSKKGNKKLGYFIAQRLVKELKMKEKKTSAKKDN